VAAEIVHDHVESDRGGMAGAEFAEGLQQVGGCLALMDFSDEALGVNIVEGQQLLGALKPAVGGPQTFGVAAPLPMPAMDRAQFERTTFIEADYSVPLRRRMVEIEDAVFLTSNAGSGDSFQVFECWKETPSRRSKRRTHSSVMGGRRLRSRQYALSFFTDQWLNGRPRSSGRASATLISSSTRSPLIRGIGPRGLFGCSKAAKPLFSKEWILAPIRDGFLPPNSILTPHLIHLDGH